MEESHELGFTAQHGPNEWTYWYFTFLPALDKDQGTDVDRDKKRKRDISQYSKDRVTEGKEGREKEIRERNRERKIAK